MHSERRVPADGFLSFAAGGRPVRSTRLGRDLTVVLDDGVQARFRMSGDAEAMTLASALPDRVEDAARAVFAAVDATFGWAPERDAITLDLDPRGDVADLMIARGELSAGREGLVAEAARAMQRPAGWLAKGDRPTFPETFVMSGDRRHPLRPAKPDGVVYARFIPWLGRTLTFRTATVEDDLGRFHRWMNDPRVAEFWTEAGELDAHRSYLERVIADPHMIPMIGAFDDFAFAYFEIYWAKENRLAPFYDADDYDRGWHVAVGEDGCRGGAFIGAWLPSLMHCLFLDDCRTRRIVGEPAAAHRQQIANLERSGFARIKTFDFPHKRAALVSLLRERFFADRLWLPAGSKRTAGDAPAEAPARLTA